MERSELIEAWSEYFIDKGIDVKEALSGLSTSDGNEYKPSVVLPFYGHGMFAEVSDDPDDFLFPLNFAKRTPYFKLLLLDGPPRDAQFKAIAVTGDELECVSCLLTDFNATGIEIVRHIYSGDKSKFDVYDFVRSHYAKKI